MEDDENWMKMTNDFLIDETKMKSKIRWNFLNDDEKSLRVDLFDDD